MASYYYLISSLPDLKSDGEMPVSYSEFLDMCKGQVSKDKYRLLENLTFSSEKGPLVEEWARVYDPVMEELNYQRNVKLGKPCQAPAKRTPEVTQRVNAILGAKNPLQAEKMMLAFEFQLLDELVGLHMFDDYVLFGYAIKLKLMERQQCFDHDKGQKEFRRLMDIVRQRVYAL